MVKVAEKNVGKNMVVKMVQTSNQAFAVEYYAFGEINHTSTYNHESGHDYNYKSAKHDFDRFSI